LYIQIGIIAEFELPIGFKFVEFPEYLEDVLDKKVDVLTPDGVCRIRVANTAREIVERIEYIEPKDLALFFCNLTFYA